MKKTEKKTGKQPKKTKKAKAPKVSRVPKGHDEMKFDAELQGITIGGSSRDFHLKITDPGMRKKIAVLYTKSPAVIITFNVPVEKDDGEVTKWEEISFETIIRDVALKPDYAKLNASMPHDAVVSMSNLLYGWGDDMEFYIAAKQTSIDV